MKRFQIDNKMFQRKRIKKLCFSKQIESPSFIFHYFPFVIVNSISICKNGKRMKLFWCFFHLKFIMMSKVCSKNVSSSHLNFDFEMLFDIQQTLFSSCDFKFQFHWWMDCSFQCPSRIEKVISLEVCLIEEIPIFPFNLIPTSLHDHFRL